MSTWRAAAATAVGCSDFAQMNGRLEEQKYARRNNSARALASQRTKNISRLGVRLM
jgi:hypothetical protein